MPNKERYFSLHNFIDKYEHENEDKIKFEGLGHKSFKLAMSDGAGGAGIYCKDWAQKLVDYQPDSIHMKSKFDWDNWYLSLCDSFFRSISKNLPDDIFIREKFTNNGSYATLLYLWRDNSNLYFIGTGDTTLFLFKTSQESYIPSIIYPINNQKTINSNPYLLNWNMKFPEIQLQRVEISEGDVIICATDSIARWIINHLFILGDLSTITSHLPWNFGLKEDLEKIKKVSNYGSLSELISDLLKIKTEIEFELFIKQEIEKKLLTPDDFTLFTYVV